MAAPTLSAPLSQTKLLTAGVSLLPCFDVCSIPLRFGSCHFYWSSQLALVFVHILGFDFLRHHALLVDMARARVLDADSLDVLYAVFSPSASDPFCAYLQTALRKIQKLISEYPDVLSSDSFSASTPKHRVFQDLPTVPGHPVFAKARRLDPGKLPSAKAEFLKMEKACIVCCSSSLCPVLTTGSDGSWRPCWDFCHLNTTTLPNKYPLPTVADFSTRIAGSKFFS